MSTFTIRIDSTRHVTITTVEAKTAAAAMSIAKRMLTGAPICNAEVYEDIKQPPVLSQSRLSRGWKATPAHLISPALSA